MLLYTPLLLSSMQWKNSAQHLSVISDLLWGCRGLDLRFALLHSSFLSSDHIHPLILTGIPLMMYPLLNHPLMLRIPRIQHLNRLPPSLLLPRIIRLHRQTSQQHTERQSLRIHTCLYQLLRTCEIWVAMYEREGDAHGGDPGAEDDAVTVVVRPVAGALPKWFRFFYLCAELGLCVGSGFFLGMASASKPREARSAVMMAENVPVEHARNVRNGTVRPRKAGYLRCARMTPAVPC